MTDRRGSTRHPLRLVTTCATSASDTQALIHDLSISGLLIECSAGAAVGEYLNIRLPDAGEAEATIVWNKGRFFGCKFTNRISPATVTAALLLSPGRCAADHPYDLFSMVLAELRALSSRVRQITERIDRVLDSLADRNNGRRE